jgi:hypothetical protein
MARTVIKLRCPGCGDTFKWSAKGWPKFCPMCGYTTAMPQRDEIQSPYVSAGRPKALLQSAEQTYRELESSSARNAIAAADAAGVPASEMSSLKITDLNTQLRPGDIAAKPVVNDVTRFMDRNRQVVTQMQANAMGYAAQAHSGKDAYAGARAFAALRGAHAEVGPRVVLSGQKVAKGERPSVQPMISAVPTREVADRVMRQGGKNTF